MDTDRQTNADGFARPTPPSQSQLSVSTILGIVWNLVTTGTLLVLRLYVKAILFVYQQIGKLFKRAVVTPLEPIFVQVQKVPKKDVSAEGIFYQLLRLQFLVGLFLFPYFKDFLSYLFQPIMRAHDWAIQFSKGEHSDTMSK